MLILPPLSLYIHMPWCVRKCPYCDFNSHALRDELPEKAYIDALILDLDQDLKKIEKRPLISIFFGGGTPSLFSPQAIEKILTAVQTRFDFEKNIEITLEANPGTVEYKKFIGFRAAGINRLSIGIQSFQTEKLKILGRIHNGDEAKYAVEAVHAAGFSNFNLDLMHGLPQQTVNEALKDLETAIQLKPTHLSWYQLNLEPNTLFYKNPPPLPEENIIFEMQEQGYLLLKSHRFHQYEISAFSLPNKQSRHNRNYWEFGDYLGIGAGAHSKITDIIQKKISRNFKFKNPKDYLNLEKKFIAETKIIPQEELSFEFMLNALRLYEDIPVELFITRTGLSLSKIEGKLKKAGDKELLYWNDKTIRSTELGRRFYNELAAIFL